MNTTPAKTLEDQRDDLCKARNDEAYINGVLDFYNAVKKYISETPGKVLETNQQEIQP